MIGNTQAAWITVTAVYAVISVFVLVNTYMTCTERVQTAQKSKEEDVPFWTALKATVTNRYFLIALGLMLFYTVYQIIIGTDLTYYCQYVLGNVNLVTPLSASENDCDDRRNRYDSKTSSEIWKEKTDLRRMSSWNCRTADLLIECNKRIPWNAHLYHERIWNCSILWSTVLASK